MLWLQDKRSGTRNNLNTCVDLLRSVYRCNVDICTTEENEFCGIFVQNNDMRETLAAFPEIIFVDATNYSNFYFLFACEDSNGSTEIVGMGLLMTEDASSVRWLMEKFKIKTSMSGI